MNTELMKAVERMDGSLGDWGICRDQWQTIRQALRDLEAENARLREESSQRFIRGREWAELSGRQEARAEKAEALLRECDEMARRRGDKYGLCDAIDNDWHPYQSAALAAYLQGIQS